MLNPIFQKLLLNKSSIKPFLQWYSGRYPNSIALFQDLPFAFQIGIYLEYFESMYNLIINVTTRGYSIQFSDNRKVPIYGANNMQYNHYKYDHTKPKSIIYGYELGIIWLFENYALPF